MAESILKIHTQNGDVPVGYPGLADKPISDKTLSKEGAFADAKVVGDKFKEVKTETDSLKEDLGNYYPKKQGAFKCINMVSNLPDEVIMPSGIEKIFWMVYVLSMVHLQLIIQISLSKNLY